MQVASLQSVLEGFLLNDTEPVLVQRKIRTFVGEEALQFGLLSTDDCQGNVFSRKGYEYLQERLKRNPEDHASKVMRLRYILYSLAETRLARVEMVRNFHDLRYMLSVALVPQLIVMVIILSDLHDETQGKENQKAARADYQESDALDQTDRFQAVKKRIEQSLQ